MKLFIPNDGRDKENRNDVEEGVEKEKSKNARKRQREMIEVESEEYKGG